MKKMLVCMLVVVCLVMGLFSVAWMDNSVEVASEKYDLFQKCLKTEYADVAPITTGEMNQQHGEVAAIQYANLINYYYDTGDRTALMYLRLLIKDPWGEYAKGTTPVSSDGFPAYVNSYVPGSASPASAAPVTEAPFPDVQPDAWYAKAVSEMKDSGIIEGCDDGLFHPERPVTIGELYAMVLRAVTSPTFDVTVATGVSNDTHWANGVLENARQAYLWPPEMEHADDYALRGEAVSRTVAAHNSAMLSKYAQPYKALWTWTMARERTEGNMTLADIPDHAVIEQYLQGARITRENDIVSAYNYGITKGIDEAGTFNPYGTLTRAEATQLLYNAKFTERTGAKPDGWFL